MRYQEPVMKEITSSWPKDEFDRIRLMAAHADNMPLGDFIHSVALRALGDGALDPGAGLLSEAAHGFYSEMVDGVLREILELVNEIRQNQIAIRRALEGGSPVQYVRAILACLRLLDDRGIRTTHDRSDLRVGNDERIRVLWK